MKEEVNTEIDRYAEIGPLLPYIYAVETKS
jgi:hypothetical protein